MTTALIHWLSPSTMQALGWTLLHFLWQGTALAALAAGFMALSGRAQVRYRIGVAALVLMFLAPVGTFVLSSQPHSAFSTPSQPVASAWAAAKAKYQASATAPSSRHDGTARGLGIAGIVVGALGLLTAAGAIGLRRRAS